MLHTSCGSDCSWCGEAISSLLDPPGKLLEPIDEVVAAALFNHGRRSLGLFKSVDLSQDALSDLVRADAGDFRHNLRKLLEVALDGCEVFRLRTLTCLRAHPTLERGDFVLDLDFVAAGDARFLRLALPNLYFDDRTLEVLVD